MALASPTAVARRFSFVRETLGENKGAFVSKFQRECGGKDGDSWCAFFVSFVLDVACFGAAPLRPTGSTRTMLADCRTKGLIVTKPVIDGLFFYVKPDGTPHHVGIVTDVKPDGSVIGIAGNTSEDGKSSNGTGVFEHEISTVSTVFARLS